MYIYIYYVLILIIVVIWYITIHLHMYIYIYTVYVEIQWHACIHRIILQAFGRVYDCRFPQVASGEMHKTPTLEKWGKKTIHGKSNHNYWITIVTMIVQLLSSTCRDEHIQIQSSVSIFTMVWHFPVVSPLGSSSIMQHIPTISQWYPQNDIQNDCSIT